MNTFWKKLYHKYIKQIPVNTVQLRGRLSDTDNVFLKTDASKYVLSKRAIVKKIQTSKQLIFLEVGFGNGSHIVELAKSNTDTLVLGSEMYMAGVVNTLRSGLKQGVENFFVTSSDARDVLKKIQDDILDRVYILFPDPWPKVRHNKRRLVKIEFVELVLEKLKSGGLCIIATDWAEYAGEIKELVDILKSDDRVSEGCITQEERENIFKTTFAKRAQKEGREISLFVLRNIK